MLVHLHPWALVSLLGENRRAQSLTPQHSNELIKNSDRHPPAKGDKAESRINISIFQNGPEVMPF